MLGTDTYHIAIELDSHIPDYRNSSIFYTDLNDPLAISNNLPLSMSTATEPLKGTYLGEGIIRLYREFELDEDNIGPTNSNPSSSEIPGDDSMVCISAVPTYFTVTDLLGFLGKQHIGNISHMRILKSEKPNRFIVLIKFTDVHKAAEFQHIFNGKAFNSMEPETCHALFVRTISIDKGMDSEDEHEVDSEDEDYLYGLKQDSENKRRESLIPFLLNDPFTTTARGKHKIQQDIESERLVELPTCPVCLERMDSSVTGLLTIPCQHTFHCQCLSKWKDDSCPICRYSINVSNQKVRRSVRRLLQFRRSSSSAAQAPFSVIQSAPVLNLSSAAPVVIGGGGITENSPDHCSQCNITENLWICLVCGNLGCERYSPLQHSLKHFIETGHCFAMDLETSRVWDYVGDNYVHRLIANESDGKLVELPEKNLPTPISNSAGVNIFDGFGRNPSTAQQLANPKLAGQPQPFSNFDKIDEVGFEYSQLLISQLASQREYYEGMLQSGGGSNSKNSLLETKVDELSDKLNTLSTAVIPKLETKIKTKDDKISKLSRELVDSKSLNEGLSDKVDFLSTLKGELESKNQELEEQVKDLMFFLETQEKFKDKTEEERQGQVIMQKPSTSKSRRKKK